MNTALLPFNAPFHVENDEETFENWMIVDSEGGTVASIPKGPTEEIKERQWQVANSLAAAPELLEACQRAQNWLREYITQLGGDPLDQGMVSMHNELVSAIAKAEGR